MAPIYDLSQIADGVLWRNGSDADHAFNISSSAYELWLPDGYRPGWDDPNNERCALQATSYISSDTEYTVEGYLKPLEWAPTTATWGWHNIGFEVHSSDQNGVSPLALSLHPNDGDYTLNIRTTSQGVPENQVYVQSGVYPSTSHEALIRIYFKLNSSTAFCTLFIDDVQEGTWSGSMTNTPGQVKVQLYRGGGNGVNTFNGDDRFQYRSWYTYAGSEHVGLPEAGGDSAPLAYMSTRRT